MAKRSRRLAATAVAALLALTACGGGQGGAQISGRLPGSDHVHALRAGADGVLLLGLHGALWASSDGGRTWRQLGLQGQDAMAIGVPPGSDGPLLVGGHGVLARRRAGAGTFESLAPPALGARDIHALAQAPTDPRTVYAFVVDEGIFASPDGGDTWELRAPPGPPLGADITALAVDPQDPQIVVAAGARTGIARSSNGARSFAKVSAIGTFALAYVSGSQRLVAITARGIEASNDSAHTWQVLTPRTPRLIAGEPTAIAADDAGTIWLVTEKPRTLQRSSDGGRSWQEVARA